MSKDKLASLEKLQALDAQIDELTKTAGGFPARRGGLETDRNKALSAADQERGRLADVERARGATHRQLEEEKDKVKKWEARLPQLKTPREFAALQREVENAKKANLAAEETLKTLDAQIAEIKLSLRTKEAELSTKESALAAETSTMGSQEGELREKIATLTAQREAAKANVDPGLLRAYETIRKKHPGKALVPVENGTCTGCRRRLPPQAMNRLYVGGAVEACPSCMRLVYVRSSSESQAS